MSTDYDIAIVGGGMVGASLALALARAPLEQRLNIALFEAYELPPTADGPLQPSYDARSTALAYATRLLLEQLGIWAAIAPGPEPILRIEVSDRGHFGAARLRAEEQRVPALGYVVENRALGQALLSELAGQAGVALHCPAAVIGAEMEADDVVLRYSDVADQRHQCRARLLVLADGGRSALGQQLQLDRQETDYEQCAVIANLSLDRSHEGRAYERFTATGPMALLPLSAATPGETRAALVWSVPLAQADEVIGWDDAQFIRHFHDQFGYRAGCVTRIGERHSYPLKLSRVKEQARRRMVVLGNAAHTLHPIAGQGFNLALRGALALADVLVAAQRQGQDLGDPALLQAFVAGQAWDQDKTIGFSDRTTRLFSNADALPIIGRNLGLMGLDLLPPLKRLFAASAMGLDQPAPRFLQELTREYQS